MSTGNPLCTYIVLTGLRRCGLKYFQLGAQKTYEILENLNYMFVKIEGKCDSFRKPRSMLNLVGF